MKRNTRPVRLRRGQPGAAGRGRGRVAASRRVVDKRSDGWVMLYTTPPHARLACGKHSSSHTHPSSDQRTHGAAGNLNPKNPHELQ